MTASAVAKSPESFCVTFRLAVIGADYIGFVGKVVIQRRMYVALHLQCMRWRQGAQAE